MCRSDSSPFTSCYSANARASSSSNSVFCFTGLTKSMNPKSAFVVGCVIELQGVLHLWATSAGNVLVANVNASLPASEGAKEPSFGEPAARRIRSRSIPKPCKSEYQPTPRQNGLPTGLLAAFNAFQAVKSSGSVGVSPIK